MRLLAFAVCQVLIAQASVDDVNTKRIRSLSMDIRTGDKRVIARLIRYPFARPYPLKDIRGPQEFVQRFDEVFDDSILAKIRNSDPISDWERMGWQGIMLGNGDVWLDDFYKIQAVNHETSRTHELLEVEIQRQKLKLPKHLREFDEPILKWNTKRFVLRVDRKNTDYRLVVFSRSDTSKELLTMNGGRYEFDGQLGDFHIDWQNNERTYRISSESRGSGMNEDWYYVYETNVDFNDWPETWFLRAKRLLK